MKRKYIKPTTSVVRVETQNNYCNTASTWSVRDASGAIQSNADKGYVLTDEDESERAYDPWNSDTW
ncbi:MAG: hypothetical protein EGQ32_05325 [Prevotella sp.]|nr:hypothetical protein [Prevotella sp.]